MSSPPSPPSTPVSTATTSATAYREKYNETVSCIGIVVHEPSLMSTIVKALQKTDKVFVKKAFTSILDCSTTLNHSNATIKILLSNKNDNQDGAEVLGGSSSSPACLPKGSRVIVMDPSKVPLSSLVPAADVVSTFETAENQQDVAAALKAVSGQSNTAANNNKNTPLFSLAQVDVRLSYLNYTSTEILSKLLPAGVVVPSGFEQVGHIVHLNLSAAHQPYKHLIAQVILDCAPRNTIRTVINKTESISSEFRELPFELLGGDADYNAVVKQHGITFHVPYDKVYWNSRLSHEHTRLVTEAMQTGDQLIDVMAGVGPFALPAVSSQLPVRLKSVYANDLNPASVEAMRKNIEANRIAVKKSNTNNNGNGITFETFVMDGRKFIREIGRDQQLKKGRLLFHSPSIAAAASGNKSTNNKNSNNAPHTFRRHSLRHFVMNLPATAVLFLDAFTNTSENGNDSNWPEPLQINTEEDVHRKFLEAAGHFDHTFVVHVYCFSAFSDQKAAMNDAVDQVAKVLKRPTGTHQDQNQPQQGDNDNNNNSNINKNSVVVHKVHIVRDVAPNKLMVCVSFSPSIMAPAHLHDAIKKEICVFDGKCNVGDRRERT